MSLHTFPRAAWWTIRKSSELHSIKQVMQKVLHTAEHLYSNVAVYFHLSIKKQNKHITIRMKNSELLYFLVAFTENNLVLSPFAELSHNPSLGQIIAIIKSQHRKDRHANWSVPSDMTLLHESDEHYLVRLGLLRLFESPLERYWDDQLVSLAQL